MSNVASLSFAYCTIWPGFVEITSEPMFVEGIDVENAQDLSDLNEFVVSDTVADMMRNNQRFF